MNFSNRQIIPNATHSQTYLITLFDKTKNQSNFKVCSRNNFGDTIFQLPNTKFTKKSISHHAQSQQKNRQTPSPRIHKLYDQLQDGADAIDSKTKYSDFLQKYKQKLKKERKKYIRQHSEIEKIGSLKDSQVQKPNLKDFLFNQRQMYKSQLNNLSTFEEIQLIQPPKFALNSEKMRKIMEQIKQNRTKNQISELYLPILNNRSRKFASKMTNFNRINKKAKQGISRNKSVSTNLVPIEEDLRPWNSTIQQQYYSQYY